MEEKNYEQEIDLLELITIILSRWYIIALSVLGILAITAVYTFGMQEDVYTAQSSIIIQIGDENTSDSASFVFGQRLVETYTEFARSNVVINGVKSDLNLTYSNNAIRNMISIQGVRDTVIIKLSVESGDPDEAAAIANTFVSVMQREALNFQYLDNLEILDTAEVPMAPSGPNRILYLAIGVVLGGMIGVFAVFALEFFDKSIKSTKDIENKLQLRVLGSIPDYTIEEEVEQ